MGNLTEAMKVRNPDDINRIIDSMMIDVMLAAHESQPVLTWSELVIERLWDAFSSDRCAQWMTVTEETMRDFKEWLKR
jgi:hypothetical protein